jgi:hypothetical protein
MCWTPLCASKTQTRHVPSYKQLEVKTNQTTLAKSLVNYVSLEFIVFQRFLRITTIQGLKFNKLEFKKC